MFMPPSRPSPQPAGSPRRRPGPMAPSAWVWLVIMGMALLMLFLWNELNSSTQIEYSDLIDLVTSGEVTKATFRGKDELEGEIKDAGSELAKKLKMRST